MLNVVVLNGGRGAATLIPALLERQGLHVTSVVNAYDDGKSTGEIRSFFGMLGPSDIRKVQQLMLPKDDPHHDSHLALFTHRYSLNCEREPVLEDLRRFVSGESNSVAGIPLSTPSIIASLRLFTLQFLEALRLIEKVQGRTFSFADCSLMNCLYAGAFLVFNRNLEEATKAFDRLFRLRGIVLPTSNDNLYLVALRENGEMLYSEAEIVELRSNVRIERVFLLDHRLDRTRVEHLTTADKRAYLAQHHCPVSVSSGVTLALKQADIIIYSAGTQHSSLYPTYMASGLASTIADNRSALKVFVTNIGADYETPSYKASDYLHGAYRYLTLSSARHRALGELVDRVLVNQSYRKANETYVIYDEDGFSGLPVQITIGDYESLEAPGRHDGNKLIDAILAHYEKASIAESRC
jgi:2-phospho-L-lactate transferase/gluconeogenesis factor (CofD/UPF0052 family)